MTVQVLPHDRDTLDQIVHDATLTTLSRRHGFTKTPARHDQFSALPAGRTRTGKPSSKARLSLPESRLAFPLCPAPHAAGHSGFACGSGVFGVGAGR
mgnify:CR=1 FL=1|jgi:hypothetical protein